MRNSLQSQRHSYPRCYVSSLELVGFFAGSPHTSQHFNLPTALHNLQGLTNLSLSYSSLSDELLMALHPRHRGHRRNCREGGRLQMLSLHCTSSESQRQVVSGESWEALVSSCPGLKVILTVDRVINTVRLARILQQEIPLVEFHMTAFYSPDDHWSAKPIFTNMLPLYRRRLQHGEPMACPIT
ncbi:hypothetical protein INR49_027794 [Caranx melampygus]|nr:hypothetical protein INR49_027794 [Caranx melampygus]